VPEDSRMEGCAERDTQSTVRYGRISGNHAWEIENRANEAVAQRRFVDAIYDYEALMHFRPGGQLYPCEQFGYALALMKEGRLDEAKKGFEELAQGNTVYSTSSARYSKQITESKIASVRQTQHDPELRCLDMLIALSRQRNLR